MTMAQPCSLSLCLNPTIILFVHLFVTPRDSSFPLSDRIPSYFLSLPPWVWGSYYSDGKWLLGWHLVTFKEVHLSVYYSSPSWMKSICVAKMACCPLPLSHSLSLWMPSIKGNGKVVRSFVATLKCHAEEKIFNGLSVAFPALTCQVIRNSSPSHTHSRSVSLVNHLFFIPPLPRAITPC